MELEAAEKEDLKPALPQRALFRRELEKLDKEIGIQDFLEILQQAFEWAALAPPPPGPTKVRARNAFRTAYIQDMAKFTQRRFKKPLYEAVAVTINVSMKLYEDDQVTEDLVRKIVQPKKQKVSVKVNKR